MGGWTNIGAHGVFHNGRKVTQVLKFDGWRLFLGGVVSANTIRTLEMSRAFGFVLLALEVVYIGNHQIHFEYLQFVQPELTHPSIP
jgi:hypothetical protein